MFKRILVPIDGSTHAMAALEGAKRLAKPAKAAITVLHVETWAAPVEEVRREAAQLNELVAQLRAEGLEAHPLMRFDEEADDGITAAAIYSRADLIVLVSERRAGMDALFHPSVTASLLGRSPAPLLILPEKSMKCGKADPLGDHTGRILVPLDTSAWAEVALPYAIEFARRYDRELTLMCAASPPIYPLMAPGAYAFPADTFEVAEHKAQHYLAATRDRLMAETGMRAHILVTTGAPETDILQIAEAKPIRLIVMSTHGRTGATRALLGSVARHVMRHARIPVLVIPPHVGRAAHFPVRRPAASKEITHVESI